MTHNPAECVKCGRGRHVRGPVFAGHPIWQWVCCKEVAVKTRPYQPSNGTEGMIFDDRWCANCQRDKAYRADENSGDPCDILSRSFVYKPGDAEYPVEWIEDDVKFPAPGNPRCTAFVAIVADGVDEELQAAREDKRQMGLPL